MSELLSSDSDILYKWTQVSNLFFKKSLIHIDNPNMLAELALINPLFLKLINSNNTGGSRISKEEFIPFKINNSEITPSSVFYFYNQVNNLTDFFLNNYQDWYDNIDKISFNKIISVNKNSKLNEFFGWKFISEIQLPINSAIISDRYFIKYENSYNENLFKIIDGLLFNISENIPFHLSIFSQLDNYTKPQNIFNKVSNFLKSKYPKFKFELTLHMLKGNDCPHDRNIITNYFYINSDNSFDFYNQNGFIQTNTFLKVVAINSDINSYFNLLNQYKDIVNRNKGLGSNNNRLLEYNI
jgi:hypothetical protein